MARIGALARPSPCRTEQSISSTALVLRITQLRLLYIGQATGSDAHNLQRAVFGFKAFYRSWQTAPIDWPTPPAQPSTPSISLSINKQLPIDAFGVGSLAPAFTHQLALIQKKHFISGLIQKRQHMAGDQDVCAMLLLDQQLLL